MVGLIMVDGRTKGKDGHRGEGVRGRRGVREHGGNQGGER